MSLPIITAVRALRDPHLKESVLHTAQELAHRASIYGVVRASNAYMGQKCHCHQRTFQRHVLRLIDARILKKTVVKRLVKVRVGERLEDRLRNEVNVYTFTLPWKRPPRIQVPIDRMSTTLPQQEEREKSVGLGEDIQNLEKGLRWYTAGSLGYEATLEKITQLKALLDDDGV